MPIAPFATFTASDARDGRQYNIVCYRPHMLAVAINELYPQRANRFAVNIGAGDGVSCHDPVFPLYQLGFAGLAIEGGDVPALAINLPWDRVEKRTNTIVTPDNIADVLAGGRTPTDCDFLKIDIDGYDAPVLEAILRAGFLPKVIQAEINPEYPPPLDFCILYSPNYRCQDAFGSFGGFYGASLSCFARIGRTFGYRVAYIDHYPGNSHDVVLTLEEYLPVAHDVFGLPPGNGSIRDIFLDHPPMITHFTRHGINSFPWRARTDYYQLLDEVWQACMRSNLIKHGNFAVPFRLDLDFPSLTAEP